MDSAFCRVGRSFAVALVGMSLAGLPDSGALAADKPPQVQSKSLFPLKRGLKWEYTHQRTVNGIPGAQARTTREVGDIVEFGGTACHEIIVKDGGNGSVYYYAFKEGYLCEFGYDPDNKGSLNPEHNQPFSRQCKLAVSETASWTDSYNQIDLIQTQKIRRSVKEYDGKTPRRFACTQTPDKVHYAGVDHEAVLVVRIDVLSKEKEKVRSWYVPGIGLVRREYHPSQNEVISQQLVSFSGGSPISIGDVVVQPKVIEKEGSVNEVEAAPGVVTTFKERRTISREVSWSAKVGVEFEIESKLAINLAAIKSELNQRVKAGVEAAMGEKLTDTETREQDVKIDGNKLPKARVIWIDIYREGTVDVTQDGKVYKVPFKFPVGTKLMVK